MATKQKSAWSVILTISLFTTIFFACTGDVEARGSQEVQLLVEDNGRFGRFESQGLSAELEKKILMDWYSFNDRYHRFSLERYFERVSILGYYGTYNDYVIVDMPWVAHYRLDVNRQFIPIANGFLEQVRGYKTFAWKNGQFIELIVLLNQGKLTMSDQLNIASLHPRWSLDWRDL